MYRARIGVERGVSSPCVRTPRVSVWFRLRKRPEARMGAWFCVPNDPHRGRSMARIRIVAASLAGTGLVAAVGLTVPGPRHALERASAGRWHRFAHHDRVAREIRLPREVADAGSKALTASQVDAARNSRSPKRREFGAAPKATEASAAQQVAQAAQRSSTRPPDRRSPRPTRTPIASARPSRSTARATLRAAMPWPSQPPARSRG